MTLYEPHPGRLSVVLHRTGWYIAFAGGMPWRGPYASRYEAQAWLDRYILEWDYEMAGGEQ